METEAISLKQLFKSTLSQSLGTLCGLTHKAVLKNTLTVLTYHEVTESPSEFSSLYCLNVPPKTFDFQINFIKTHFNVIGPDDLLSGNIPERAALVTFDDGFRSYFQKAVPIMERHGVPSINFVNAGPIQGEIFYSGLIAYLCAKTQEFARYMSQFYSAQEMARKPLLLLCRPDLVEGFLTDNNLSLEKEVSCFVSPFATGDDLMTFSTNPLVYYGNHFYNHYIALWMSDEELIQMYSKNASVLRKYTNFCDKMFAFTFGQPETCYSRRQVEMLMDQGAQKVFSSNGMINQAPFGCHLHRVALNSFHDTDAKIWFKLYRKIHMKEPFVL